MANMNKSLLLLANVWLTGKPVLPPNALLSTLILKRRQSLVLKSSRMSVSISREDSLATEKPTNLYLKWSDTMSFALLVFWHNITKVVIVAVVMSCSHESSRGVSTLKNQIRSWNGKETNWYQLGLQKA